MKNKSDFVTTDDQTNKDEGKNAQQDIPKKGKFFSKKNIPSLISWCIFGIVFCLLSYVLGCRVTNTTPTFFGYSFYVVVTDSMEPTINIGDTITVKKTDISNVEEGQIILFESKDASSAGKKIVHRVQSTEEQDGKINLVTKGDNVLITDPQTVSQENFLGVVVSYRAGSGVLAKIALNSYVLIFLLVLVVLIFVVVKQIKNINNEIALQQRLKRDEIKKQLIDELNSTQKNNSDDDFST